MTVSFIRGDGYGFVGPHMVLLADRDAPSVFVDAVGSVGDLSIDTLIEIVSRTGLAVAPSFAAIARDDVGYRFLVRGRGRVALQTDTGTEILEAPRARSWSEFVRDACEHCELSVGADATDDAGDWVTGGRVPAAALLVPATHFAPMGRAEAEPVQQPLPADRASPAQPQTSVDATASVTTVPPEDETEIFSEAEHAAAAAEPPARSSSVASVLIDSIPDVAAGRAPVGREARVAADHEPVAPLIGSNSPGERQAGDPTDHAALTDPDDELGDHDGHTMHVAGVRAARSAISTSTHTPTVRAVHCPRMHPNPTHASECRICGDPIADPTIDEIARPSLGVLLVPPGDSYPLDRPMLIGRRPGSAVDADVEGEPARLVALTDQPLVSKLHLEVRVEDWQVIVVDRNSTNNTYVTLPGKAPMQLRPGEPALIVPGTAVDLAGSVVLRYELEG